MGRPAHVEEEVAAGLVARCLGGRGEHHDTGQVVGPGAYGHGGTFSVVANQFAAMPSMHFGWALLVAWAVIVYAPSRYRYLIVLHPVLTLLAIVVTANHYWVDAAVAALNLRRGPVVRATSGSSRGRPRARIGADRTPAADPRTGGEGRRGVIGWYVRERVSDLRRHASD